MPSGGYRPNAGRPKKTDIIAQYTGKKGDDNKGIFDFGPDAIELEKEPPAHLTPSAKEIYSNVYEWLKSMDCLKGIHTYTLEQYATNKAWQIECENKMINYGLVLKDPSTEKPMQSPYFAMRRQFQKDANEAWTKIHIVVFKAKFKADEEREEERDPMEDLFNRKGNKYD